jgi:C4-dicarboxylate-specific signal transduction histidine kinase
MTAIQTWFRNLGLRRKLDLVIGSICTVVLLLACAALFIFQEFHFQREMRRDLLATAEIISANSIGPLKFRDQQGATEVLSALKAKPQIASAHLEMRDGTEFARLAGIGGEAASSSVALHDGLHAEGFRIVVAQPVLNGEQRLGTLYLSANTASVHAALMRLYGTICAGVLVVSLLMGMLLSTRLQGLISQPILTLAGTAREVAEDKNYSVRAKHSGTDEVGLLTDAFNQMLSQIEADAASLRDINSELQCEICERERTARELEALHGRLLETSRRAGMAEVATSVLHNVGNVLNSVNVSASVLRNQIRGSRSSQVIKLAALFQDNAARLAEFLTTDPRGQRIPGFLAKLATQLSAEQEQQLAELDALRKNIDHIKEIVAMQQSYARVSGVTELVSPASVVEDALRIDAGRLDLEKVEVVREFEAVPETWIDRHKVMQILINLIRNARHAICDARPDGRQLRIQIRRTSEDRMAIQIIDNGSGIAPENLVRVFQHGFTTKKNGHGFGLHSGANAAVEMGGSLTVHSSGLGHGATFTLELPLNQAESVSKAA